MTACCLAFTNELVPQCAVKTTGLPDKTVILLPVVFLGGLGVCAIRRGEGDRGRVNTNYTNSDRTNLGRADFTIYNATAEVNLDA